MSGFVFMFMTQLYESLTAVYECVLCAHVCVGEEHLITRGTMHSGVSTLYWKWLNVCVWMYMWVYSTCVICVCWSDCVCVFVCTTSEPACLCTDNLTNTMRSVLPLSIYGCGWSVGGFLCKVSPRSVQEVSLNMRQSKICFFNTNMPFYLKNQFVLECHVYILGHTYLFLWLAFCNLKTKV